MQHTYTYLVQCMWIGFDGGGSTDLANKYRALTGPNKLHVCVGQDLCSMTGEKWLTDYQKVISLVNIERGTKTRGSMDNYVSWISLSDLARSQPNQQFVNCATVKPLALSLPLPLVQHGLQYSGQIRCSGWSSFLLGRTLEGRKKRRTLERRKKGKTLKGR